VFFRVSQQEVDALSHFAHFNQNARWPCTLRCAYCHIAKSKQWLHGLEVLDSLNRHAEAVAVCRKTLPAVRQLVKYHIFNLTSHNARLIVKVLMKGGLDDELDQIISEMSPVSANEFLVRGRWHQALGHSDQAEADFVKHLEIQAKLIAESSNETEQRKKLAQLSFARGDFHFHRDEFDKAFPKLNKAI
jgi:tetratricopeptide (TPR) repeat protein